MWGIKPSLGRLEGESGMRATEPGWHWGLLLGWWPSSGGSKVATEARPRHGTVGGVCGLLLSHHCHPCPKYWGCKRRRQLR